MHYFKFDTNATQEDTWQTGLKLNGKDFKKDGIESVYDREICDAFHMSLNTRSGPCEISEEAFGFLLRKLERMRKGR